MRLGNAGVHRIVLGPFSDRCSRPPAVDPEALEAVRKHGSAVGHLARVVSKHAKLDPSSDSIAGCFAR